MNVQAQNYWDAFWKDKEMPTSISAWQFGGSPDVLAQLVVDKVKTATCSGRVFYELEKEPLPKVDDYSIVLNSKDEPVCIIRTSEVTITPMNKVSEAFAYAEGEGDRSYDYWKKVHVQFFTEALREVDLEFSEDMLLVCERFELIDVK
ncbi:ASCH domain-containing protein [Psychrobacillus glaciei]|uniref:ASCH domain-containing protein n=1 Tax=Psychrobacillus glaciei TaxID=2283160 RepID=A0A5J6SSS1_9BACI|nr:ASCH domain-containing protein [Psychrobacillus glaciei]QFG00921.1 ASCH domain-containing protein [Psychrobacillus glaciei]